MSNSRQYNYTGRKSSRKSKSARKREAYNYRAAYFKKNPGLFGCIWFCSQCGIPMFGKDNVQVDHIIPLAGLGINRTINTVAICSKCNSEKSDKGGKYAVKGIIAKIFEATLFTIQKIVLQFVVLILRILHAIIFGIVNIIKLIFSLLGQEAKIVLLVCIVIFIYACLK